MKINGREAVHTDNVVMHKRPGKQTELCYYCHVRTVLQAWMH